MWSYRNPVQVSFGVGALANVGALVRGRAWSLVTYPDTHFDALVARVRLAVGSEPAVVIRDVVANPDYHSLRRACERYRSAPVKPGVIVAVGGGSALDAAKVLAAADGDFERVREFLETGEGAARLAPVPIIAVPTTAGTGSEMTCWATVWDTDAQRKHSLALPGLYPEHALIDPELTLGAPRTLTVHTALDALSHSLESLWNKNANPVSSALAVTAARTVIDTLPQLADDLDNLALRSEMARAAMFAGMAFSNTRTALAHSLSYAITLRHGVPHGLACSFTLPWVMRGVIGADAECDAALVRIFGADLHAGARALSALLAAVGVSESAADHGVRDEEFEKLVSDAFAGERGRNFIGEHEALMKAYR